MFDKVFGANLIDRMVIQKVIRYACRNYPIMKTRFISLRFVALALIVLAMGSGIDAQTLTDSILRLPVVVITDSTLHRMIPRSTVELEMIRRSPSVDLGGDSGILNSTFILTKEFTLKVAVLTGWTR